MDGQETYYYFVRLDRRVMKNILILRTLVKPFLPNETASSTFSINKEQTLNFWAWVMEL